MRLSSHEHQTIVQAVRSLDPAAEVYLFGSRADPNKRGGDIDLLILSKTLSKPDIRKIRWKICDDIGEQKIDIVIAKDTTAPFVKIALSKGIAL